MKKNILFLYSEVAGYFLSAVKELVSQEATVLIVHWSVKSEAPFDLSVIEGVQLIDKDKISYEELEIVVNDFYPEMIVTSGWMDKDYIKLTKKYFNKIPTVLTIDNHWKGTIKQQVLKVISGFWLKRIFSHAWGAGAPQAIYANKLGYSGDHLKEGYYTADVPFYDFQYSENLEVKQKNFPHVFLYVGRYIEHKGIYDLWKAFIQLHEEESSDWELWCVGTGELFDSRMKHEKIKHLGFLQPEQMAEIIPKTGVLILPSHFEPWGVVVHEFAGAGYPMLLSNQIGASTFFLKEGDNGFAFSSKNVESLKESMKNMISLSDEELFNMGIKSNEAAMKLTPKTWVKTLFSIFD